MNNFDLCKAMSEIDDGILGTGIVERAKLVAMYNKPKAPMPSKQEFGKLFMQTEIIISMLGTNVSLFGKPRYFTLCYEECDLYFFPLSRFSQKGVLVIQIVPPYDHSKIIIEGERILGHYS